MIYQLIAHLAGDYIFQSDWMANEKTSKWFPAVARARVLATTKIDPHGLRCG